MRAKVQLICLVVFSSGALWAQNTAPVGIILAASSSFVQFPGIETSFPAAPGMELRPGFHIKTGNGSVRFAFCPEKTAQTLSPGQEIEIPSAHLRQISGLYGDIQKLPFCELPPAPERLLAALDTSEAPPVFSYRSEKAELLITIQQAEALARGGDPAAAAQQYRRLAADYPEATWTRGVIARYVNDSQTPSAGQQGKIFALLIGISKYPKEAPLGDLMYADSDANSFAEFLRSKQGDSLPDSQIKLVLNEEATRDGIDSAVNTFVNQAASKQNTLILFVASHGHFLRSQVDPETGQVINQDPYIVTADAYRQELKTTGYPMNEFRRLIAEQTQRFGRVIVYLDICHAGYVANAAGEDGLAPAVKRVFVSRLGNMGVMMASDTKFAYEAAEFGGHGAFTYYVLHGLYGGAARPQAPVITFADLFRHVVAGVGELTNNAQSPDKFVIDDQMAVLDHVPQDKEIPLPKATSLLVTATRRRRGSLPGTGQSQATAVPQTPAAGFEALARKDPLAAISAYSRIAADPSLPQGVKRQNRETLRVSLEEHGQQIVIQYLRGEQVPQTKAAFELGARYFEEALKLAPLATFDESRMLFCQGRALVFTDGQADDSHYETAARLLERAILLDPTRAYAYNALGIAYLQQVTQHPDYYDRAVAAFHDAIRFAPDWAYPVHNLALTFSERGQFAAAGQEYRNAMKLAPQYSYLPYNLALLNQRLNRLEEAERLYRLALSEAEETRRTGLVPPSSPWKDHADILNALGSIAATRHKYKAAAAYYEGALKDDPQLPAAKYNLAALLSRTGPSQRAVDLWHENIAADPKEPASRLALAEYMERQGDRSGAISAYEAAVQVAEKHVGARRALAALYAEENRWPEAYDQLKQARALSPQQAGIAEEFANAAVKVGRVVEAAAAYRAAEGLFSTRNDRKRVEHKLQALGE